MYNFYKKIRFMEEYMNTIELCKINEIVEKLKNELNLEENKDFFLVSTKEYDLTTNPKGRNSKKSRSDWADKTVEHLFNKKRREIEKKCPRKISTGEYNFTYIKFAEEIETGEIYGIVHGKSSFHKLYPGDVWFYDFADNKKKELKDFFEKNGLKWHTEKILIIKNQNVCDYSEAMANEKMLKNLFKTFD